MWPEVHAQRRPFGLCKQEHNAFLEQNKLFLLFQTVLKPVVSSSLLDIGLGLTLRLPLI